MSLPSAESLRQNILALPPSQDEDAACLAFAMVIANFMDQIQGGPTGMPGILTFNAQAMANILEMQAPVDNASWAPNFAAAWQAGIIGGTITPGTVSNPIWIGSGGYDTATSPSISSTVITLSAAAAMLSAALSQGVLGTPPAMPMATAIYDAAMGLTFLTIGLGAPPTLTPIPITTPAQ